MSVEQSIEKKLTEAFAPRRLDVVNESHLHSGHAGSPGTGESHFRVTIVSDKFAGLSRVQRHRLVNAMLADELTGPVHALALKTLTPTEAGES
jgi:BolA protein